MHRSGLATVIVCDRYSAYEKLARPLGHTVTLTLNRIDGLRWLEAWLRACAHNGGRRPDDTAPWLPWSMDDTRRREMTAPG